MPIELPTREPHARFRGWNGPTVAAALVTFAGASTACSLLFTLPPPLVLPAVGVLATLAAGIVALIALTAARQVAAAVTCWDVAGALTLIGIVATLLSEPELALPLLDNQRSE